MSIRVEENKRAERARGFVEGLADFLKVAILYPISNKRVQESADALIRRQQPLLAADGKLPLVLDGEHFKVGDTKVKSGSLNVAWLVDCCHKTCLAGLYLDRTLKYESLFALAKSLHRGIAVSSNATTFQEFWPEQFKGIRLLEKRFRGSFGEAEELAEEVLDGLDPSSREAELMTALLESDKKLIGRMRVLREVVGQETYINPDSATVAKGVHPLRVIINNLPGDAFRDVDTGVSKVKDVLDQVIETIKRNLGEGKPDSLEVLAQEIITRAFHRGKEGKSRSREGEPRSLEPAETPVVQEEPEEDAEERNKLLAELQALPDNLSTELKPRDLAAPAEELGILVHQYLRAGNRETRARLESLAAGYLQSPAAEELAVLDQFLHLLCSPRLKPKAQVRIAEFAQFLQDSELGSLLTQFKRFSKQTLVDSFPASFGLFIDSIDIGNEKEREKIGIVCRAIGAERIREHRDFLGTRAGILAPNRIKKILSLSSRDVLPLAQIILDYDTRPDMRTIVRYLVGQNLKGAESAALRAIPSPERLPTDYLSDLCSGYAKGIYRPGLTKVSESLIHRFVKEPPRSSSQIEQQARAVMALGEFPTRETRELLGNLIKGSGLFGRKKGPKPISQAAQIVMRMLSGGR